jgi:hypothetical protein
VDESTSEVIVIRSEAEPRGLDDVLARIYHRRQEIARCKGPLDESAVLVREGREQDLK